MTSRVVTEALGAERVLVRATTERDWLQLVRDYAVLMGWLVFHAHDSRRSPPGFPDLVLCRRERLILAETKTEHGVVRADQKRWLAALEQVPGITVAVWRPSQWVEVRDALC